MLVSFLMAGSLKVPHRSSMDLRILFKNTGKWKETHNFMKYPNTLHFHCTFY